MPYLHLVGLTQPRGKLATKEGEDAVHTGSEVGQIKVLRRVAPRPTRSPKAG